MYAHLKATNHQKLKLKYHLQKHQIYIKYTEINLTKDTQGLYTEICHMLLK